MVEEKPVQPEGIEEVKEEASKELIKTKEKPWLKPVFFTILGIIIAGGLVFAGYKLGQRGVSPGLKEEPTPTVTPEEKPITGFYHTPGMDFTIDRRLRVERKGEKDLLVLTVTFIGAEDSPWPKGTIYQYDTRALRLVDEEGFIQEMLFSYPTIKYLTTNPISQRALKPGEKDRGEVFFEIPKDKDKFFLTYGNEMTEKIIIEPELFDPTADWKTHTSQEFGYSIKYPSNFTFRDLSTKEIHQVEFSGVGLKVIARVKEEKDSFYYLDQGFTTQIEVGEVEAKLYEFPKGYCDAGECTQPFIAAVFYRNNMKYILEFYGLTQLTETANLILSTFKFLE